MVTKSVEKSAKNAEVTKSSPEHLFPMGLSSLDDMDRIFDEYFNRNLLRSLIPNFSRIHDLWGTYEMRSPSIDIIDREKDILIRAELPGVDKKDLDVSVSDNLLVIKGTSKYESSNEKNDYYNSEIKKGTFSRSLSLPSNVDATKIKASLNNGLLELTIPKIGKTKRKTIKVS